MNIDEKIKRIAELERKLAACRRDYEVMYKLYAGAEDDRDALEQELDSLWETLIRAGDELGIASDAAHLAPGKPSDVYMAHLERRDKLVADRARIEGADALFDELNNATKAIFHPHIAGVHAVVTNRLRREAEEYGYEERDNTS